MSDLPNGTTVPRSRLAQATEMTEIGEPSPRAGTPRLGIDVPRMGSRSDATLPGEGDVRAEGEIALRHAEAPLHLAGVAVEPVGGPGVTRVDEQIPVFVEADRVEVKIVPGGGPGGRKRLVALVEADVIEAVPLEEDAPARDVDLLHDTFRDEAGRGAADGREIARHRIVSSDQRRSLRREVELVNVGGEPVAGAHRGEDAVVAIRDVVRRRAGGRCPSESR